MNGNDLVQGNRNDVGGLQGYHGTSNTAGTQDSVENQPARMMQQQNMQVPNAMMAGMVQPNTFLLHPSDAQQQQILLLQQQQQTNQQILLQMQIQQR